MQQRYTVEIESSLPLLCKVMLKGHQSPDVDIGP